MIRRSLTLAVIAGLAPAAASAQPADPAWMPTWADEFSGATLNTANWTALNIAWPYNDERQYYRPSAVTVAGGLMTITATNQPFGGRLYTSGRVESGGHFAQQYGRFEFRAKLPRTQGLWPALWILPATGAWPPEVDVMELLGHDPDTVYFTTHYGTSQNPQHYGHSFTGPDFSQGFHTFTLDWWPERMEFRVDGVVRATHTTHIPREPFFIIMNVAVGGIWPGYPDATTVFPQTMQVDYVRVYSRYLANESFEDPGPGQGTQLYNWTRFGNAYTDANQPRTSNRSAKLFGNFTGSFNTSGFYQDRPAQPGQRWRATSWWLNRTADPMQGQNSCATNIEWRNAQGQLISFVSTPALDASSPRDTYLQRTVEGVAPAGTATVRVVELFFQPAMSPGAAWIDDVALEFLGDCQADFNTDGFLDFFDLDAFVACFESGDCQNGQSPDFNADGFTDFFDLDAFVAAYEQGC